MPANDSQVAGGHYKSSIQHWDYVVANDLDYFQAQITKYVTRWKKKNGLQDLQKAKHFLEKYIELAPGLLDKEADKTSSDPTQWAKDAAKSKTPPLTEETFRSKVISQAGFVVVNEAKSRVGKNADFLPELVSLLVAYNYEALAADGKALLAEREEQPTAAQLHPQ